MGQIQSDLNTSESQDVDVPTTNQVTDQAETKAQELTYVKNALSFMDKQIQISIKTQVSHSNFKDWLFELKSQFNFYQVSKFLEGFKTDLTKEADFQRYNSILINVILRSVDPTTRDKFCKISDVPKLIKSIENYYAGNSQIQAINLFNQAYLLMNQKPDNLDHLVTKLKQIIDQYNILILEGKIDVWKCLFLNCLSDRHEQLKSILISNNKFTIGDYCNIAIKQQQLFQTNRSITMNNNIINKKSLPKSSGKSNQKFKNTCFECDSTDHDLRSCNVYKNKLKSNEKYRPQNLLDYLKRKKSKSINNVQTEEMCPDESSGMHNTFFGLSIISNIQKPTKSTKLYIDSGATDHMVNNDQGCSNFNKCRSSVFTASGESINVIGTVNKSFQGANGLVELNDCLLIPDLHASFISVPKLDEYGCKTHFSNSKAYIYKDEKLLFIAQKDPVTNLYEVNVCSVNSVQSNNTILSPSLKWHQLLGHINYNSMKLIAEKVGIKMSEFVCETCSLSKQVKSSFKGQLTNQSTRPGQILHTDLSGKIRINNKLSVFYFLLVIDDFSRFTYIFLINNKSQTFKCMEQVVALIKNKFNRYPERIHSDNGTEFKNSLMDGLCKANGITQTFTTIDNPQQNGCVERTNRTIETVARSLLVQSNLSVSYWPYAIKHAVFIKNRVPHSAVQNKIPFEIYNKVQVNYDKFHLFGSKVYIKETHTNSKFNQTSTVGFYLGDDPTSSSHLVYSVNDAKVLKRLHVKFTNSFYFVNSDIIIQNDLFNQDQEIVESDEASFMRLKQVQSQSEANMNQQPVLVQSESQSTNNTAQSNDNERNVGPLVEQEHDDSVETSNSVPLDASGDTPALPIDQQFDEDRSVDIPSGTQVELNKTQKSRFAELYPFKSLSFIRPVNRKGVGSYGVYRVNSLISPNYNQIKHLPTNEQLKWSQAMSEEISNLQEKGVFETVVKPISHQILPTMWVFRIKYNSTGQVDKYKARVVALGNLQSRSKTNVYSPVINDLSLRVLLAYGVKNKMHIHHIDVCSAYLNAPIQTKVYVNRPPGINQSGVVDNKCWLLHKSLYGLGESASNWYKHLASILINKLKFVKSTVDDCVFVKRIESEVIIFGVYVDDSLVISNSINLIEHYKSLLNQQVTISDRGSIRQFLNLEIEYNREDGLLSICQQQYIEQLLIDFGMSDCKHKKSPLPSNVDFDLSSEALGDRTTFLSILGRMIYLSTKGRYDILLPISKLCQYMNKPTCNHLYLLKHVLKYLSYTKHFKLYYSPKGNDLIVYCDANFNEQKSTSGICTMLFNCLVNCMSKKQSTVATSTTQAETNAIAEAIYDQIFIFELLSDLDDGLKLKRRVLNDNQSSIQSVLSGGCFLSNRHYKSKINLIRDSVARFGIDLEYVSTEINCADAFTKPLTGSKLLKLMKMINLRA